jgi:predicted branched-subunit amino acid permease
MEYADLFLAATLGAILAAESRNRATAALVVAVVAMSLAAFLLVTDVIPATVPVAAALAVEELRRRYGRRVAVHGATRTGAPRRANA